MNEENEWEELDSKEFQKKIDDIIKHYSQTGRFLNWVSFLVSEEEALRESLKLDEYQTRDYFAREGVEMLPGEVKYLMDAVEGVLTALDFFREYKENQYDNDFGMGSTEI